VSDGENVLLDSELAGNRPYILARNLKSVPVIVDKDRIKAIRYAIKRFGSDVLILDDGCQYLHLRSTLHIVLIDNNNFFGNYRPIARGILREPLSHSRSGIVHFLTKSNDRRNPRLEQAIHNVNDGIQIVECCHPSDYCVSHDEAEILLLEILHGKNMAIFCSIASPEGFEQLILSLGANIIYKKHYIDDHRFTNPELYSINQRAKSADFLITTEKDAVQIADDFKFNVPFLHTCSGTIFAK
jgi:tetraacyldisaccharide 4'-kinase